MSGALQLGNYLIEVFLHDGLQTVDRLGIVTYSFEMSVAPVLLRSPIISLKVLMSSNMELGCYTVMGNESL